MAITCYSRAISNASHKESSLLAEAFSNRSVCWMALKNYAFALEDAENCASLGYCSTPERKEKTDRRIRLCESKVERSRSVPNAAEPLFPKSPKIEFRFSAERGRHAVATESIALGEVLLTEQCHVHSLIKPAALQHCYGCLKPLKNRQMFFPCISCCDVFYCSRSCQTEYYNRHKIECGFVQLLQAAGILHLVVKTILHQPQYFFSSHFERRTSNMTESEKDAVFHMSADFAAIQQSSPIMLLLMGWHVVFGYI